MFRSFWCSLLSQCIHLDFIGFANGDEVARERGKMDIYQTCIWVRFWELRLLLIYCASTMLSIILLSSRFAFRMVNLQEARGWARVCTSKALGMLTTNGRDQKWTNRKIQTKFETGTKRRTTKRTSRRTSNPERRREVEHNRTHKITLRNYW